MRHTWKSLSDLAHDAAEFPPGADAADPDFDRREFLEIAGAGLALAGLAGCSVSEPDDVIVPYRTQPPEVTPGKPTFYATAMSLGGYATGLLAESHQGRPTKIEGNPDHPASLGATDIFAQAMVLGLYDPERLQQALRRNVPTGEQAFFESMRARVAAGGFADGRGLRFLLEATSSPTVARLLEAVRKRYPRASVHFWEPCHRGALWDATRTVYGQALDPFYDLSRADVVVSLDADFLARGPWHLVQARKFAERRTVETVGENMSRLYVIESDLTPTGAAADHRLAVSGSHILTVMAVLFSEIAIATMPRNQAALDLAARLERHEQATQHGAFIRAMARDLFQARGKSLVIVGAEQAPMVQALGIAINELLGNLGKTVSYGLPAVLEAGEETHDLLSLANELRSGVVETLVILGGDPAYNAPADLDFAEAMGQAKERIHLTLRTNRTSTLCDWVLPRCHELESWADARAYDGTASIVQPLVKPLYDGHTDAELLQLFTGVVGKSAQDVVRETWQPLLDDSAWREALVRGVVKDSASAKETPLVNWEKLTREIVITGAHKPPNESALEVTLVPDARVFDGRFIGNAWLLEVPAPITTLSWDNAAHISVETAKSLGLRDGDVVSLASDGRHIDVPVLIVPGHADSSLTISLGYGQRDIRGPGRNVGFDAYPLRTRAHPSRVSQVSIEKKRKRHELVLTQNHWSMSGRDVVKEATLTDYVNGAVHVGGHNGLSMRKRVPDGERQWGMVIDLGTCSGCNACVIACQAENNIPVVGKAGVRKSREMLWLRIDRYFVGDAKNPRVLLQPMLCQHCENAPCEYVCPTHATTHSPDGLNEMTYNRCVGTRFCANNCPYKVRRFNWFNYHRAISETERMQQNPDVTVRARGVMEKCTFCVQRLRERGIEERIAPAGEEPKGVLETACQAACASRAIAFGDLRDPSSAVSRAQKSPRMYGVLEDLNTVPRVRYLAKITNPNPELDK